MPAERRTLGLWGVAAALAALDLQGYAVGGLAGVDLPMAAARAELIVTEPPP